MRICLVSHGFPPLERTGVENYTAALAAELAARGHTVEVFAPRVRAELPQLSLRREERDGYGVNWITTNVPPRDPEEALEVPGVAGRFGDFLDRERPQVVHFQHLVKLGIGLVDQARRRDIATVYTAHDYYAVCHRYTLLRPDLSRCEIVGDSMLCARCDLALGHLNGKEGLGDYQMGVLPEQLDEGEGDALRELLDEGEPEALGHSLDELDAVFDRRQELDGRRAQAYGALDRILAPTRFLASQLVRGGIDPDKVQVLPYGIDTSHVAGVPPVAPRADAPLRFGFLSGLSKHKGVHVLIEAFRRLREPAELAIWGYSSDEPYVERMRAAAAEAGAVWRGGFDRDELAGCLAETDVVVVPSIWVENQPIVIREAFAAGRPVIAPRLGALPESVNDGVDGLLYEPDDADALAAALARCVREEGLVAKLAAGIQPVHEVAGQCDELEPVYAEVGAERRLPRDDGLPASVRAFAERYDELRTLPTRTLYERALQGLEKLRAGFGGEPGGTSVEDLLRRALKSGSRVQTRLRDQRREADWMKETLDFEQQEVTWMRTVVADHEAAIRALEEERDWLRSVVQGKEQEVAWLSSELDKVRGEVLRAAGVGEQVGMHLKNTAELGLAALQAQEHVLGEEVRPLLEILERVTRENGETPPDAPRRRASDDPALLESLVQDVREGARRLMELENELAWRRSEMQGALVQSNRRLAKIFLARTGLGSRINRWRIEDARRAGEASE